MTGCAVTGIDVRGGEIAAVETTQGTVRTSTVVCAAGAWSREIGALAGVELDVTPVRRQIALTGPTPPVDAGPAVHDRLQQHLLLPRRRRRSAARHVGPRRGAGPRRRPTRRPGRRRCGRPPDAARPGCADLAITEGWAGLYENTPDASALIGEAPDVGRFLYATGFSGHGFCQAPATGEIVADLVLGREPFVDVAPLRAERFAERSPVAEANIV